MIRSIYIRNFRAFKELRLEPIGKVNIIVGRNNTGKSTLLEAIYLACLRGGIDILNNASFDLIFYRRGIPFGRIFRRYDLRRDYKIILEYLFYNINEKSLEIKLNDHSYNILIMSGEELIQEVEKRRYLLSEEIKYHANYEYIEPILGLRDNLGNFLLLSYIVKRGEIVTYKIITPRIVKEKLYNAIFIDEYTIRRRGIISGGLIKALRRLEMFSKVNIHKIKKFLALTFHDVIDIEEGMFDIYFYISDDKRIPLSLLGDGVKFSLFYLYTLSLKNFVILMEEPENHLHPGLMNEVAKLIAEGAETNQIFITTHSLEFLRKVLRKLKEKDINTSVFSFKSIKNGVLEFDYYDLNEAYTAMDKIGVDLR